ncbi:hypothetical protein B0H13DRAFT_2360508 [Mycena leptocephala]|nr:hypothetical protein B0H13DRAFT_2360508 [Mycena leptocephala]
MPLLCVFEGFVRGIYTNSWIARDQTERYTDSRQKSFKKKGEADAWWALMCTALHQNGCRPSSRAVHEGPTAAGVAPVPAVHVTAATFLALHPPPSVLLRPLARQRSRSPPPPKKEKIPGTPNLHLNVPPSLPRAPRLALPSSRSVPTSPPSTPTLLPNVGTVGDGDTRSGVRDRQRQRAASHHLRPRHGCVNTGSAVVAVFYNSFAAARAAAVTLELPDAKIMVSDNPEKLEAWMTGKPFVGED